MSDVVISKQGGILLPPLQKKGKAYNGDNINLEY